MGISSDPLQEQLYAAWKESGLTLVQLLEQSGLRITFVSLSRKLRGKQKLSTSEFEALNRILSTPRTGAEA